METTKEIVVDMWKTSAHSVEMGIRKEEQLRAKSRQFTKDTDIYGDVKINDKESGYITFREEPWKLEKPNKQIILKFFTKGFSWKASLEQLVAKTMMQSVSGEMSLPYFMINISSHDYLMTLEKIKRKPKLGKNQYVFSFLDDTLKVFSYSIETDRFTLGSDWVVRDQTGEKIAEIDGAKFNVGGKYTIKINENSDYYNKVLDTVFILFAGLNKFLDDVENELEESIKLIRKGEGIAEISKEEALLYLNPRRVKM